MDMAKNARVALLCLNCGIVQTGNTKHCCLPQLILFVYWWEERKLKSLTPTKSALGTDDKVPPAQAGRAGSVTQTHRSFWEPAAFFSDYLPDHVCGNSRRWNASMKEACSSQPIPFCHTAAFSRYWCQSVDRLLRLWRRQGPLAAGCGLPFAEDERQRQALRMSGISLFRQLPVSKTIGLKKWVSISQIISIVNTGQKRRLQNVD